MSWNRRTRAPEGPAREHSASLCLYRIVRYLPDAFTGDRLTVGVVAGLGAQLHVRFLHDWSRVQAYAGEEVLEIRRIAEALQERWDAAPGARRVLFAEDPVLEMLNAPEPRLQLSEVRAVDLRPSRTIDPLLLRLLGPVPVSS